MAGNAGKRNLPAKCARGQGTFYCEEIVNEILDRICAGETMTYIVRHDINGVKREKGVFPQYSTIYDWADPSEANYKPDFAPRFAKAKLHQHRFWIEETIEISNNTMIGYDEIIAEQTRLGVTVLSSKRISKDMTNHRQMMIETRFKAASKLDPDLWMERLQMTAPPNGDGNKIIIVGGLPETPPASDAIVEGEFKENPPE